MAKLLCALVMLTACGDSSSPPDAIDARTCEGQVASTLPHCDTTCGNGKIDACAKLQVFGDVCSYFAASSEPCDGADNHGSCTDLGYYGGAAGCTSQCTFDDRACTACASNARLADCKAVPDNGLGALAASDPQASGPASLAIANGTVISVLQPGAQGLAEVARTTLADSADQLAAVPGGWWAAAAGQGSKVTLYRLDLALTTTTAFPIASNQPVSDLALTAGPGGRALVTWAELVFDGTSDGNQRVWAAIVGPAAVEVAPFVLFPAAGASQASSATSDGTSFFVAASGKLARIAADGTIVSTTAGYPIGIPHLSWSGSAGWYVVSVDSLLQRDAAQRFDASGALLGALISIDPGARLLEQVLADGTDLLTITLSPVQSLYKQALVRIGPTGEVVSTAEIGVGALPVILAQEIVRLGGNIAVAWYGAGMTQIARVTP